MANILRASIACFALSALALTAAAQEVGSVETVAGEADAVIVLRGTETFSLSPDDVLFEGDRVITRATGTTEISAYDCTRTLASLESITIAPDFCTQTIAFVGEDGVILADAGIVEGGGVGAALPVIGALAAAGAAAAAGGGSDGASSP